MKRIISFLLVIVVMLSLSACGESRVEEKAVTDGIQNESAIQTDNMEEKHSGEAAELQT